MENNVHTDRRILLRRFDSVVEFPMPDSGQIRATIDAYIDGSDLDGSLLLDMTASAMHGRSYGEIETTVLRFRRKAVVQRQKLKDVLKH